MNGRTLSYLLIVVLLALCAESVFACGNQPPVAQINRSQTPWEIFVPSYTTVTLDGSSSYDPDGYIQQYQWTITRWNGSYYAFYAVIYWDDPVYYWSYNVEPGSYQVELNVIDNQSASSYTPDSSWVLSADVSIDDCPSSMPSQSPTPVEIDYTLEPEDGGFRPIVSMIVKNAGGSVVRYMSLDDDLGSQSAFWDGKDNSGQWVPEGTYTIFIEMSVAYVNTFSDSTQIDVYEVDVDIDSPSFPISVRTGESLQLTASREGHENGTYSWSLYDGPATPTFSPDDEASTYFTASQSGNYIVQVEYTEGGVTVSEQSSDAIEVVDVEVEIDAPAPGMQTLVGPGGTISALCTTQGLGGGQIQWSPASWFNNPNITNPQLTVPHATTPGNYSVGVMYTEAGISDDDTSGTITVPRVNLNEAATEGHYGLGQTLAPIYYTINSEPIYCGCSLEVQIYDSWNNCRRTYILNVDNEDLGDEQYVTWDGRDDSGNLLPAGSYSVRIYLYDSQENEIHYDWSDPIDGGYITILEADLEIWDNDEHEEDIGYFIQVNDDDDNHNGTFDFAEYDSEDVFQSFHDWQCLPSAPSEGWMALEVSDPARIRLWDGDTRYNPPTMTWELSDFWEYDEFDCGPHSYGRNWYLVGAAGSESPRDVSVILSCYWPDGAHLLHQDVAKFTVVKVDLDADSDNDGTLDRNGEEEKYEETHTTYMPFIRGAYVLVNDDDNDEDGVPDFADGFDWDGTSENDDDDPDSETEAFTEIKLELDKATIANGKVKFSYLASNPAYAGLHPDAYTYTPDSTGTLRIWTKDGNASGDNVPPENNGRRRKAGVPTGDYIVPNQEYTPEQLGFSAGKTSVPFYVEAVSRKAPAASCEIKVLVDPDGSGTRAGFDFSDSIYMTPVWVGMNMSGVVDCQETHTGGFIPKDGLVQLTVEPVWPEMPGDPNWDGLTLDVEYEGDGEIRVWNDQAKTSDVNTPESFRLTANRTFWVEGYKASSDLRDITLVLTHSATGFEDRINLTVFEIDTVAWEKYPDYVMVPAPYTDHGENLDLDVCPTNGGMRIFPGRKHYEDYSHPNYNEVEMRRKVRVKATITPPISNRSIHFLNFDVDDPSPHDPDSEGGDNITIGPGTLLSSMAATNSEGIARVTFIVSYSSPGDNYRIAVSLDTNKLAEPYLTQTMADANTPPAGVEFSPMLTVWRKLWIEQDSMGPPETTGAEKNYISDTGATYSYVPSTSTVHLNAPLNQLPGFREPDHFNEGWFEVSNIGKQYYVLDTVLDPFYLGVGDKLQVMGDPNGDGALPVHGHNLYDDDYDWDATHGLHIQENMPKFPTMGSYESEYYRAYILPTYASDPCVSEFLPSNVCDIVPFDRNLPWVDVDMGWGTWNDYRDLACDSTFWLVLVVSGWQSNEEKDGDPTSDGFTCGQARRLANEAVLFCETQRDQGGGSLEKTMAHEVGHTGGLAPPLFGVECTDPNCLMHTGATGETFCDWCIGILRYREIGNVW